MKLANQTWRNIFLLIILVAIPAGVKADTVADWNAITVQATITGARPNPTGVIDIAMVQVAVYDAVQAIEKQYEPYYVEIPGASGSPVAAAAKAAHDVLVSRFPAQAASLDTTYQNYLLLYGIPETDPGVAVGARAAAGIIALRACDGSFPQPPPPPFVGGTGIGVWRPTPPANSPMVAPWLGNVVPFTLTRPSQFRSDPPASLTSRRYTREYNEVKALGALNSIERTPDQTDVANFYAGNTLIIWNQVLRGVAVAQVNNISDSTRLFALADLAIADAMITSWNDKTHYVFWRPITAIQQGNNDGNPETVGDATWLPLITTPAYPEHTSGANAFAGAATHALALFFGTDNMTFSVMTTNTGPTIQDTRVYVRFSDAAQDVVDARIYSGLHFRTSDEAARKQGKEVAKWVFKNFLRPLDKHDGDAQ
jgi:hypothetical protein